MKSTNHEYFKASREQTNGHESTASVTAVTGRHDPPTFSPHSTTPQ